MRASRSGTYASFGGRLLACLLGCLALAIGIAPSPVGAQSPVCRNLEAQLSALPRGSGNAQIRAYDRAIARQSAALDQARERARGCRGFFANRRECAGLTGTIKRMTENLADLQRKRGTPGGGDARRQRARIMAALDANGCRVGKPVKAPREVGVDERPRRRTAAAEPPREISRRPSEGNFRTMCVRLCDGYYFPISFSVPPSLFARDAGMCESQCPGADVALYVHRVPEEESEAMVSASDGTPYRDLSTAFLYRRNTARPKACGCIARQPEGFSVLAGERDDTEEEDPPSRISPSIEMLGEPKRPAPETVRPGETPVRPLTAADRRVRVVGPRFLPDPEEAIDLRAPVPTPAP